MLSTEEVFSLVKAHLHAKKPLSLIRYGDGESMMFDKNKDNTAFILQKVMGYCPPEHEVETLKQNLIEAYKNCDIIGMPTERHLNRRDQWAKTMKLFDREVGETALEGKLLASIDIFYDLLHGDWYGKLFSGLESINYVSCRNLDNAFKEKFGIKNVNSFIIAPEPTYTSGYEGLRHYPEQFMLIKNWIDNLSCAGELCLVGAGIPGKPYNNWFRDKGGIVLDVGSVFDFWAGFRTRGKGRGMDAVDNTWKL